MTTTPVSIEYTETKLERLGVLGSKMLYGLSPKKLLTGNYPVMMKVKVLNEQNARVQYPFTYDQEKFKIVRLYNLSLNREFSEFGISLIYFEKKKQNDIAYLCFMSLDSDQTLYVLRIF